MLQLFSLGDLGFHWLLKFLFRLFADLVSEIPVKIIFFRPVLPSQDIELVRNVDLTLFLLLKEVAKFREKFFGFAHIGQVFFDTFGLYVNEEVGNGREDKL